LHAQITHPIKHTGRIVLGPRQVRNGYARIVATADGGGRIEMFDAKSGAWCEASAECTFGDLWSGTPISNASYLSASLLPDKPERR
jgi:hypothetical protein